MNTTARMRKWVSRWRRSAAASQGTGIQVLQSRGDNRIFETVDFIQRGASLEVGDWHLERIAS